MQRYASLMIREVQIKTTKSHHLISVMAIIKKTTNNIRWWGCMKGTCIHYWWEHKVVQPIWKTVWKFLKKLNKTIQDVWIKILWWEIAKIWGCDKCDWFHPSLYRILQRLEILNRWLLRGGLFCQGIDSFCGQIQTAPRRFLLQWIVHIIKWGKSHELCS